MTKSYPSIVRSAPPIPVVTSPHKSIPGRELGHHSARTHFTADLSALVLATAATQLADASAPMAFEPMADLVWPVSVIVTAMSALFLNRAWDSRSRNIRGADFTPAFRAYAWTIAALSIIWIALGLQDQRLRVLCTLPAALLLTLAFRYCLATLSKNRSSKDPLSTSVIIVGSRSGASAFLTQCKSKLHSYWNIDAVCLAGNSDHGSPRSAINSIPVVGVESELVELVKRNGYKMVVLLQSANWGPEQVRELMWKLEGSGVEVLLAPPLVDVTSTRLQVASIAGIPLLHLRERHHNGPEYLAKTVVDRVGAALGILAILPILLVITIGIRISSKGPVLYRQTRLGIDEKPFTIYKFRTMVPGADTMVDQLAGFNDSSGPLFKCFIDPRITKFGRVLRKYSLDELPQLFNVALGTMSLVGPRPPLPAEVSQYSTDHERRRLLVKPGITGLWQVSGRSDLSWEETIRHDLFYVENWSIGLDATILWKTIGAVSSGRGAY